MFAFDPVHVIALTMPSVIVTGASGFVGTRLVSSLKAADYDVVPLGHDRGDVAQAAYWASLPSAEHVIHLSGRSYVPDSWDRPGDFYDTNVMGAARAVEYCRRTRAHLLFVSSYVYGIPQRLPIDEDHPLAPNNPYALSKVLAERVCTFHAEAEQIAVTIVRPFNIFGPGPRPEFLISTIVDQVIKGDEVRVKDLAPRRDYLFIDDFVAGLLLTLEQAKGLRIFNLGSGASFSVEEIIDLAQKISGTHLQVHCDDVRRRQEIPDVRADITRAQTQLGWLPRVSLREGLGLVLGARR